MNYTEVRTILNGVTRGTRISIVTTTGAKAIVHSML